jgi:hypothetical protein
VNRGAIFGAGQNGAETYRYTLARSWDDCGSKPMVFVMLNPSTADAEKDDPTIRRCINFARREGYCSIQVVNLFAWRTSKPADLLLVDEELRRGPDNGEYIKTVLKGAGVVVCAWGSWWDSLPEWKRTSRIGIESIAHRYGHRTMCLGKTAKGHPRHPLYVRADAPLIPWGPFSA